MHAIYTLHLTEEPVLTETEAHDRMARHAKTCAAGNGSHAANIVGLTAVLIP